MRRLDKSLSKLLLFQLTQYWYFYIGAFLCLVGTHWTQSHLPFMAKELADIVSTGTDDIDLWKFLVLAVGIIIFRTSSRLLFFHPARVLQKDLRVELLERLENASPARYRHHSDGQLFQVLQMDMEQLRALIGFALLQVANIVIAMSILIPKIAAFNAQLLIAFIPLVVSFLLFSIIVGRNKNIYRKTQDMQGEVQNIIIESYIGKKTIKNYHAEKAFIKWFRDSSWLELWYFYRAGIGVGFSVPMLPLGIGLSMLWGAHLIYQLNLGASTLILFSGFVFLFLEPIMFLSWIGVVFARSYGSWERIQNLIKDISKESDLEKELYAANKQVSDDELNFHLDLWNKKTTFAFERGQWSVIVGKTGHGKSHLMSQVADCLKIYQKDISYVAQDPYLYSDTVIKNIFLGYEYSQEDEQEAFDLLCLFGLDYLADTKESLLEMEVGEKGKRLSGGQAKRLALVRSLLSGANILLWDDPFSSVDVILEREIVRELKKMPSMKEKTLILTTHRLTTVRVSDRCYYIDKEKGIAEHGDVAFVLQPGNEVYEYFSKQIV
jgi:ATP-binding cassette subfamily B multidrug efflux pump